MKGFFFFVLFLLAASASKAQKVDSIFFHLYTDSLKKGFFNYINVDGKLSDGTWAPLSAKEILFTTNPDSCLRFQNNDLFIDSAYTKSFVTVKAVLRENPRIWRETVIYIRKRGFDEPLFTNEEILQEYRKPAKKKKD